jgi:branched-chain amino acid transport system ATP-binding protein
MSLLEVVGLQASYGPARVLHGIDLSVEPGGALAILGANGAGKTTTLRAISGLVKATGSIRFDGKEILGTRADRIARMGIAHVPQGRGSFGVLTVRENLLAGAYQRRDRAGMDRDLEFCLSLFPQLERRIKSQAVMLSGGEQQMLAIGRAIMSKPRLLLLDEPSLGLAPATAQNVYEAIGRIRGEVDLTLVIVEENASLAFTLAAHAVVLEVGSVTLTGSREELVGVDAIRKAYLGS